MKQLFFLLLIISLNTFSQSIEIGEYKNINATVVDYEKKELYVFYKDSLTKIDLVKFKKISNSEIIYPEDKSTLGYPVSVKSKIYFVDTSGGLVYILKDNEIKRIDNSFNHKMQINSSIFTYHDTIYRYGGYGFWSQRNFFTFFNTSNSEWDVVLPIGSKVLPNGSQNSRVIIDNNDFYVYGGQTLNKFNPLEYLINDEVWKFNLNNNSWKKLGIIKFNPNNLSIVISNNNKVIYSDESDLIYLVDVVHNKLKTYKKTTAFNKILSNFNSFYLNDTFYCFEWKPSSPNNMIQLVTRNEDEFFGYLIEEDSLYETNDKWFLIGLLFITPILMLFLFIKIKQQVLKKKLINISGDNLIYKNIIHPFDTKEIQVLKLLLKTDDLVQSSQIMDIVENKTLHYAHNIKVKNHLMENLNFKLKTLLRIEKDIITSKKSKEDKRIKIYYIDKSYFYVK